MAECIAAQPEATRPSPRSPLTVRRAILPWRRRIRNISDFDFTPGGYDQYGHDPISSALFIVMFPLWLPALVVLVVATIELAVAIPFLPFALVRRRMRHSWPVEVLDRRGRVLERSRHPSWAAAGERAAALRDERNLNRWV